MVSPSWKLGKTREALLHDFGLMELDQEVWPYGDWTVCPPPRPPGASHGSFTWSPPRGAADCGLAWPDTTEDTEMVTAALHGPRLCWWPCSNSGLARSACRLALVWLMS